MSNTKQTAVDFLWGLIPKDTRDILEDTYGAYTQAKAKEKEQIMDAYGDEQSHLQDDGSWEIKTAEQYFKETYE
jgi:hypothetical protein